MKKNASIFLGFIKIYFFQEHEVIYRFNYFYKFFKYKSYSNIPNNSLFLIILIYSISGFSYFKNIIMSKLKM